MNPGLIRSMGQRYFGMPPKFDPQEGKTVLEPTGQSYGYWVGGHRVVYNPDEKKFFLFYRIRQPLGKGRGGKCGVAESSDGYKFTTIWEATKEELDAVSIEVGSLIKDPATGNWRLYVSYQAVGGPWRVDLIEADHPRNFNAWYHRTVMLPDNYGLVSMKDPAVYIVGGLYVAFICTPARERYTEDADGWRHPKGDDETGMLTSADGIYFKNFKYIFECGVKAPGDWGGFRARISSVVYLPPVYVGFFDGGTTAYDMYEEWCGVAISHDLEKWTRVSTNGPWVRSPYGCIRYIDALVVDDAIWYYYEYTRKDGSHELRVNKVNL